MERYLFLIVLTPCLLPVAGVGLLALVSLWRAMKDDQRHRERSR